MYTFKIIKSDNSNNPACTACTPTYHNDKQEYRTILYAYSVFKEKVNRITFLDFIEIKFENNFEISNNTIIPLMCTDSFTSMNTLSFNQLIYAIPVGSFDLESVTLRVSPEYIKDLNLQNESISSKLMIAVLNNSIGLIKEKHYLNLYNNNNSILIEKCSPLKQGKLSLKTEIIVIKNFNSEMLKNTSSFSKLGLDNFIVNDRDSLSTLSDQLVYSIKCVVINNITELVINGITQDYYNCIFINNYTSLNMKLVTGDFIEIKQSNNEYRTAEICVLNDFKIKENHVFYISSHLYFNCLKKKNLRFRVSLSIKNTN